MEGKLGGQIHVPKNLTGKIQTLLKKKDRLIILLLGGILLLIIALPVSDDRNKNNNGETSLTERLSDSAAGKSDVEDYASYLEGKLENALSQVEGVGRVKVMVTLEASAERIVGKDVNSESESIQETDSQGGSRNTMNQSSSQTTIYEGEGGASSGTPYVTKELTPVVGGIIVIAQGGGDAVTVQNITEAVQALFEIDTHKIKVMKSN